MIITVGANTSDEYDRCYETGEYVDQYCNDCPHKFDCSGYEEDDEDYDD